MAGLRKQNPNARAKKEAETKEKIDEKVTEQTEERNEQATEIEEKVAEETEVGTEEEYQAEAEAGVHVSAAADEEDQKELEKEHNVPQFNTSAKSGGNVRVKPKQDVRTFIGDQWYNLSAGKTETVPAQVKEILARADLLSPL